MDVELSARESAVLKQALQSYLSDLRMEIGGTDDRDFRDRLRDERETLEQIFTKLDEASQASDDERPGVVRFVTIQWMLDSD